MNMNMGKDRLSRKKSLCENHSSAYVAPEIQYKRRGSFHSKHNTPRDRDFLVPDDQEEWVLPEYRSLFHHLFLKEEDDSVNACSTAGGSNNNTSPVPIPGASSHRRKVSTSSGSPGSADAEEDGSVGSFIKSVPVWFKRLFSVSDNNEEQQQNQDEIDRHAWLDEIPIEICDKLRHIHIYV